ncbi:hypothetical protein PMF13cell1_04303 [Blautia producta]|uniref:UPF0102 protein PMF13cell1_04303 n=1 Tax=Blautia producta TaxID=33035 RepID=A0A4P6M5N4_9FIRM|nr:YraN family protein [Blautia producta]QBE98737.1 hypothetical protein PMF13cell1_04303 [Blautia producta]
MKNSTRETGTRYEEKAALFLEQQGYRILEKNFRCRKGEIDLIAMDQEYLCFVEVKFRENSDCGGPFLAVDNRKQRRICQTALFYLMKRGISEDTPCRFDLVGITPDDTALIKDAFPYHI